MMKGVLTEIITKEVQMENTTLEQIEKEGVLLDLTTLASFLEQVEDVRHARGKQYKFSWILTLIVLAKLAGEDKPFAIAEWLRLRKRPLVRLFNCDRDKVPSLNTIRRALANCDPNRLHKAYKEFLLVNYGGHQSVLVAIDGKCLRGTIPKGSTQGVHLLAAYLPEEGIVLVQVAVEKKENEISAAPRVLEALELKGRLVCGDAMFTQRKLSVQILAQGGDYIWFVKNNQPALRADVARFFEPVSHAAGWSSSSLETEEEVTVNKGHQRLERREMTLIADKTSYLNWPGVEQVFRLKRERTCLTCGEIQQETVYGLTSLSPKKMSAAPLMAHIRTYWGIENGLHHRRDVTLKEDTTRFAFPEMAEVMAVFNNFIVGLAHKLGFDNLASARRHFDASIANAFFASP